MKRFLIILLAAVLVFSGGCGAPAEEKEDLDTTNETLQGNYIRSVELTEEEWALAELVSAGIQDYGVFDYHFDESYTNIVFKVDVYREGKLAETGTIMNTEFYEKERDGMIAVLVNDTDIWVNLESNGNYESNHRDCPDLQLENDQNGGKVLEFRGGELDDEGRVVLCTVGLYQQEPEGGAMQKESVQENIERYDRLVVVYALVAREKQGVEDVQTDPAESEIYTEEDISSAIEVINCEFDQNFKGCTLKEIAYAGDERTIAESEYQKRTGGKLADDPDAQVIVFVSDYEVDGSGGDGSLNPNSTYKDWSWILVRHPGGKWEHFDHGY